MAGLAQRVRADARSALRSPPPPARGKASWALSQLRPALIGGAARKSRAGKGKKKKKRKKREKEERREKEKEKRRKRRMKRDFGVDNLCKKPESGFLSK